MYEHPLKINGKDNKITLEYIFFIFLLSVFYTIIKYGGAGRDRTDDLKLAKLPLSQLSYSPIVSDFMLILFWLGQVKKTFKSNFILNLFLLTFLAGNHRRLFQNSE